MTVDDVFAALSECDAVLYVDNGRLRYAGPKLTADDPLLDAIDAHRDELTELFTYAPGQRCVFADCYRLVDGDDRITCADHRARMDAVL